MPFLSRGAEAAEVGAGRPAYRWRNAVIGGTGFVTGVLFHPSFSKVDSCWASYTLGFGKAADGADYPAIYQVGSTESITAVHRSDDGARTWVRINDDRHQWGYIGDVIVGDPRVYGRVYLATNGRGIQYGEPV